MMKLSSMNLVGIKNIPIDIVENIIENQMPDYLNKETRYYLYAEIIADAYIKLERYNDAINKCDKAIDIAIEINLDTVSAWLNKGKAFESIGDHDEALKCINKSGLI